MGVERDDESARAWKTSARADAGDASNGAANPSTPREKRVPSRSCSGEAAPVSIFSIDRVRRAIDAFDRTRFDRTPPISFHEPTGPADPSNSPRRHVARARALPTAPPFFPRSRTPPRARGPALSAARPLDARGRRRDGSRARRPSPPRAPRLARGDAAPSRRPRPSPPSPRPSHPDTAVRAARRVDDREDAEDARRLPRGGGGRTRTRYTR